MILLLSSSFRSCSAIIALSSLVKYLSNGISFLPSTVKIFSGSDKGLGFGANNLASAYSYAKVSIIELFFSLTFSIVSDLSLTSLSN